MKNLKQIYKYNTNFKNQKKILLNIDWLTLSCSDIWAHFDYDENGIYSIENYTLEQIERRTTHFDKFLNLYKNGVHIAEILYSSNHPTILKNRSHIKFKNDLFYSGELKLIYEEIYNLYSLSSVKISRIDICADGVYHHKLINQYFKHKTNETTHKLNYIRCHDRDNYNPIASTYKENYSSNYTSFTIGSRGSRKLDKSISHRFIRYYNKTKELIDNGGQIDENGNIINSKKQYIVDYFQKNNFDLKKDVFRFEISIRGSWLNTLESFDIMDIMNINGLTTLFLTSIKNFYEFKFIINTKKSVQIDMFKGLSEPLWVKIKKNVSNKIRTIKIAVKRQLQDVLFGPFKDSSEIKQITHKLISKQIQKYSLTSWWVHKFPDILEDYKKQCKILGITYNKENELLIKIN